MKYLYKKCHTPFLVALIVAALFVSGHQSPVQAQKESGADLIRNTSPPERFTYHSYANLSLLVTQICDDAGLRFDHFFGPTAVRVRPFRVISDYRIDDVTLLGLTLADQMTATINSYSISHKPAEISYEQTMGGIIEELDGFLRVHIQGRNVYGERRAYVAQVEMSEPIYRALHSYAKSY